MKDHEIVELYWSRSETAISETAGKYGRYCHRIAYNILQDHEDCKECVNDTYLRAWNAMPPSRPSRLSAFLGKITRNLALDRYDRYTAQKRGLGQVPLALEELEGLIPSASDMEQAIDALALAKALNRFLAGTKPKPRAIFVQRYWFFCPVKEIAASFGVSESKVKMTLLRLRGKLKAFLEEEGVCI